MQSERYSWNSRLVDAGYFIWCNVQLFKVIEELDTLREDQVLATKLVEEGLAYGLPFHQDLVGVVCKARKQPNVLEHT